MENNKKRRNSILKKPSLNVEETDTDITAKIGRRISFSGKKSVKEFRAGEEEATIWGTSYEESAEFLQANTTESGLVNVNQKRIILRNRRVVVDNNRGPRRRSSTKNTVAENDKENIFVEHPHGQTAVNEMKPSAPIIPVTIKIESPVKSENCPTETQFEDKNSQTMSEPHERINICSNTFDFINYSALSNKSIVIDHSVDVTLNDNEMQLFKFKKPITAASMSPNISLCSTRDGASPNIFSQSILMSDEDINMLKKIRKDKVEMKVEEAAMTENEAREIAAIKCKALQGKEVDDNERPQADVINGPTKSELAIDGGKRITMHMNESMNVTQSGATDSKSLKRKTITKLEQMEEDVAVESKSLKRKTITKLERMEEDGHLKMKYTVNSHPILMDTSSMDISSPLRKKPMHTATSSSMDISQVNTAKSIYKVEPLRRQTIHFESAAVEESLICDKSSLPNISMEPCIAVHKSQTIYFDHNQIREDSVCQNIEPTHDISMEVSLCAPKIDAVEEHISIDVTQEKSKGRPSIYEHAEMDEDSPKPRKGPESVHHQTIRTQTDMIESSPTGSKPLQVKKPGIIRQTIYATADIVTEVYSTASNVGTKKRESIYAPADIEEDLTSLQKSSQKFNGTNDDASKAHINYDIIQGPQQTGTITQPPMKNGSDRQVKKRQPIYTSSDLIEDSPKTSKPFQTAKLARQTIYTSADIEPDNGSEIQSSKSSAMKRESIYTASDIVEDSPKTMNPKSNGQYRQSIYAAVDIVEDSPKLSKAPTINSQTIYDARLQTQFKSKNRQSIYTPADIVEESPNISTAIQPSIFGRTKDCDAGVLNNELRQGSVSTATDKVEDSTRVMNAHISCQRFYSSANKVNEPQRLNVNSRKRESIYTSTDMVEDSPKRNQTNQGQKLKVIGRQTIFHSADMDEETEPRILPLSEATAKKRESVYTATDMIEDSPMSKNMVQPQKSKDSYRQIICASDDMDEEPAALRIPSSKLTIKKRESVYNATDMIEDSPKPMNAVPSEKSKVSCRQTICASDDMEEEPAAPRIISPKLTIRKHESVYNATDMIEDSPKATNAVPTQKSKISLRQTICASDDMDEEPAAPRIPSAKLTINKRESVYNISNMNEDSPKATNAVPTQNSKISLRQTICASDDMEEEPVAPLLKQTAKVRESIHTAADMIEDLPKAKDSNLNAKHSQSIYTPADMIEDIITNETQRKSIYAPTDIISDSPHLVQESSRRTLTDMIDDSPNAETLSQPQPPAQRSAPKLIVRHMNLNSGISGDQAALRMLKNQQAKIKQKEEDKEHDNSSMDMSIYSELPKSSRKLNFAQINEELLRGDTKAFAKDRKPTMSLFDRLENKTTEEIRFDSFMDKGSVSGVIMQRAKSSLKDYTMELSTRKTLDQQQQKDTEYTMELSFQKSPAKPCQTVLMNQNLSVADASVFAKNSKNRQTLHLNERVEEEQVTSNSSQRNRQTIHFNYDNELDESRVEPLKHTKIVKGSLGGSKKDHEKDHQLEKSNAKGLKDDVDTMDLSTIESDMLKNQSKRRLSQKNEIQLTKHQEEDDDTMDLTTIDSNKTNACQAEHQDDNDARQLQSSKRQTINVRHEMDLDESTVPVSNFCAKQPIQINEKPPNSRDLASQPENPTGKSTRQTIYFNQNLELEVENSKEQPICSKGKRQTIHFNQDLDLEDSNEHYKSEPANTKVYKRQTIHFNQDLELEDINEHPKNCAPSSRSALHDQTTSNWSKRQTIHLNQDLEIEDINEPSLVNRTGPPKIANICQVQATRNSNQRQTIHFNQDLEIETTNEPTLRNENLAVPPESANSRQQFYQAASNSSKRQTIHFNQDLEIEDSNEATANKENNLFNQQLDLKDSDDLRIYKKSVIDSDRQSIHFNEDQELERNKEAQMSCGKAILSSRSVPTLDQLTGKKLNRQTIHFNQDLELEESEAPVTASHPLSRDPEIQKPNIQQKTARQTIHFNQDLELEEINTRPEKQVVHHKSHLMRPQTGKKPNRLTLHLNDDIEFDAEEDTQKLTQRAALNEPLKANYRQTIHFQQNNDLEESTMQPIAMKPDPLKIFSKPRRLTIIDNQPLEEDESPEKITAPKSSFIRTLNFNEIPSQSLQNQREANLDMDISVQVPNIQNTVGESSLHQLWSKGAASKISSKLISPSEELPDTNIPSKSSFIRTLNFNEIPSKKTKPDVFDMDISVQDKNTSEPPDDSPLYYFSAKSKTSETTSEIDRSLAEYLKAEAAATLFRSESPNLSVNMSLVAHKIPTVLGRKTTHDTVNIFEDSGTQPISNHGVDSIRDMHTKRTQSKTIIGSRATLEDSQMNLQPNSTTEQKQLNTQSNLKPNELKAIQSTKKLQHKAIITSVSMNEDCDESIDLQEEPVQLKVPNHHKTIHFTNEDAVDESFFDENLSKPDLLKTQPNRKTIFFNEITPTDEMDVTLAITKSPTISKARQSMKEILLESNMLFTSSRLLQPTMFENKRSTIYFAGKDNSMDVSTANENMDFASADAECITPTKNKSSRSRIPQLIDSAKKLQSIKKSMDIIEQELPNIGNQNKVENSTPDKVEVSRRVARNLQESLNNADIHRKTIPLEEMQLQESFDMMEIPRKVAMHAQQQEHLEREFLNETFDTVEIPRSVVPRPQLQESFETIEIPRRATTFQKNDTVYLCPNESINATQKSINKFEDVPITISDVSTFFTQKPLPTGVQGNEVFSPNTTEALRTLNVNRFTLDNQLPKAFDLEDTTNNLDIDKTRLSLVNTLDEQETEMLSHHGTITEIAKPTEPVRHLEESLKAVPSVCRKCHRHRLSVTHNETTIGSFMMYQRPVYKIDLAAIEELGTKHKIFDVDKVWRQRIRESDSFNIPEASRSTVLDDEDTVDEFISALDKGRLAFFQQQQKKTFQKESSFTNALRNKMKSTKSNWILNELLLACNIIKFTHLRIRTFAICISFTPKDPRGIQVNFNEIKLVANVAHARRWKPFDYALHYQLLVELPFDLRKLCPTSDHLYQLLEQVEEVTQDVLKTGRDMLYLILASPASLIREPSGSLYIRKYARTKNSQKEVGRIEFHIEVQNMKKVSYKSIVEPPLYEFDEQIQTLPVGNEFLRVFLANPMQYLKT